MYDDIRVIVRHRSDCIDVALTHILHLQGWSKRFKNQWRGMVVRDYDLDDVVPDKTTRNQMKLIALTILPWLANMYDDVILSEDTKINLNEGMREVMKELTEYPDSIEEDDV